MICVETKLASFKPMVGRKEGRVESKILFDFRWQDMTDLQVNSAHGFLCVKFT